MTFSTEICNKLLSLLSVCCCNSIPRNGMNKQMCINLHISSCFVCDLHHIFGCWSILTITNQGIQNVCCALQSKKKFYLYKPIFKQITKISKILRNCTFTLLYKERILKSTLAPKLSMLETKQ